MKKKGLWAPASERLWSLDASNITCALLQTASMRNTLSPMLSMGVFHFSDEALKGARKRRGKPRLDQHMRSNLEALQRSPPTKEAIK